MLGSWGNATQLVFHINQGRCTGCYTCVVSCKDWHDIPAGPASWIRVMTIEQGKYPHPLVDHLPFPCFHCAKPPCVPACPVNAINKRDEDGIVVVDRAACLGKDGCQLCLEACPYNVPQFGAEKNAKMQKCDFCLDRWAEGHKPICVNACPCRALDAGPMDEMKAKYGSLREAVGFTYDDKINPSVIFRTKC